MQGPPLAPAASRNTAPILDILDRELSSARTVLEIGSGTGQHAVAFAAAMPHLSWQPSDLDERHGDIRASIDAACLPNVSAPISLDVRDASADALGTFDAVFSCNTAHIMSEASVQQMIELVGAVLSSAGRFCYYGPFRRGGVFNTESNAAFDESLRNRNPEMGIRDLDDLDTLAARQKLSRVRTYAMPANNLLVVWEKKR